LLRTHEQMWLCHFAHSPALQHHRLNEGSPS
jgi:hypothetical protein